jgi:uroporphyrinogen decarboxylase
MMAKKGALTDLVKSMDHLPVVPLLGFPGIQTTNSTVRQNMFNYGLHFKSLVNLASQFNPDALFMMMDLSLELNALGGPVRYEEMAAPSVLDHMIVDEAGLESLHQINLKTDSRIQGYLKTMRMMVETLNVMPAAYVIGPFTLASHLMGASKAAKATIKKQDFLHTVLKFSNRVIREHVALLTEAGAEMVCVLEPSAMGLSPMQFDEFSAHYLKEIFADFDPYSVLHICGNSSHLVKIMAETGANGLSLDAGTDLFKAAEIMPEEVVVIGNVPPVEVVLEKTPEEVYAFTQNLMKDMSPFPNFILSTGCDLPPDTPLENIKAMMNAGRGQALSAEIDSSQVLKVDEDRILSLLEA